MASYADKIVTYIVCYNYGGAVSLLKQISATHSREKLNRTFSAVFEELFSKDRFDLADEFYKRLPNECPFPNFQALRDTYESKFRKLEPSPPTTESKISPLGAKFAAVLKEAKEENLKRREERMRIQNQENDKQEKYQNIVEQAVLEACEEELLRLKEQTRICQVGKSIYEGLKQLDGLSSGGKPNYGHPWVPILHASWYHLKHVNFLQREMENLLRKIKPSEELIVLDFGCGTMPTMWAIALALAGAENDITHKKICIQNHDESDEMKNFGFAMWEKFRSLVENQKELTLLKNAISRISFEEVMRTPHLLTAVHCIYSQPDLKFFDSYPCKLVTAEKFKAENFRVGSEELQYKWFGISLFNGFS